MGQIFDKYPLSVNKFFDTDQIQHGGSVPVKKKKM